MLRIIQVSKEYAAGQITARDYRSELIGVLSNLNDTDTLCLCMALLRDSAKQE